MNAVNSTVGNTLKYSATLNNNFIPISYGKISENNVVVTPPTIER